MIVNAIQPDQSTWVLAISGKLLFDARHAFQSAMSAAQQTFPRLIILDLEELVHIDSAGLGLLAVAHRNLTPMGIGLAIANAQKTVRDILLLTNMDKMYPLHDSVAEASKRSSTAKLATKLVSSH